MTHDRDHDRARDHDQVTERTAHVPTTKTPPIIAVPMDVYYGLLDTAHDQTTPYADLPTATEGYQNLVLWATPYGDGAIIITPDLTQREDHHGSDQATLDAAGAPAGVADALKARTRATRPT